MKRLLTAAAAAAALVAGTGSEAKAQDMMAGAPVFELGLYGGLSYTTSWFQINEDGQRIGFAPIFGVTTTFWTNPRFGVRLHGAYFPSGEPEPADRSIGETGGEYALNNYFADLDLVFRPWTGNLMGIFASPYAFIGGGAMWTNVAGDPNENRIDCLPGYARDGVCLSFEPSYASVGQGVVGLGFDAFTLGGLGFFGELAVHGYDSPAHVFNETRAEDKFAFTPRASLGVKFGFGSFAPAVVPVTPVETPLPPAPTPPPPAENPIRVCVVQGNALVDVDAMYNPTTGDTMVMMNGQRRRFTEAYPATAPTYAAGAPWYINNDEIRVENRPFVRFGVTRVITPAQLTRVGEFNGVSVFAETGATAPYQVLYVPVRPGCEFQPYNAREVLTPRG